MICRYADSIPGRESSGGNTQEPEYKPSVAMPAQKAKCVPATPGIRYWLADTGCPVDLMGMKSMPERVSEHLYKSEDPQDFDTANGALPADTQVAMQV